MWQHAINADPTQVSITSFNEWGEGTQIEAARTVTDREGYNKTYQDYGNRGPFKYLHITNRYASVLKSSGQSIHQKQSLHHERSVREAAGLPQDNFDNEAEYTRDITLGAPVEREEGSENGDEERGSRTYDVYEASTGTTNDLHVKNGRNTDLEREEYVPENNNTETTTEVTDFMRTEDEKVGTGDTEVHETVMGVETVPLAENPTLTGAESTTTARTESLRTGDLHGHPQERNGAHIIGSAFGGLDDERFRLSNDSDENAGKQLGDDEDTNTNEKVEIINERGADINASLVGLTEGRLQATTADTSRKTDSKLDNAVL
jgi:hypothetical protein